MTFNQYVQGFIGGLSGTFGWPTETIDFIVTEAIEAYGVSTEAEATDSVKAHAILRFKTMERAVLEFSDAVDYKADGESFSNSQLPENLQKMYAKAFIDAYAYLPQGQIDQGRVAYPDDPYSIDGQIEHDA